MKRWNIKRSDNINPNYNEILYSYKPESKSFYARISNYEEYFSGSKKQHKSVKIMFRFY